MLRFKLGIGSYHRHGTCSARMYTSSVSLLWYNILSVLVMFFVPSFVCAECAAVLCFGLRCPLGWMAWKRGCRLCWRGG